MSAAPDTKTKAENAYKDWLDRAKSVTADLKQMERNSLLRPEFRDRLNGLWNDSQEISKMFVSFMGRAYPLEIGPKENIASYSLATLFRDFPEFAAFNIQEGAAAHPANNVFGHSGQHRMLGSAIQVQEFETDGCINLLQLGSDIYGPRFMWWDAGNISFYIAAEDLKERRFDRAKAEIFGH